MPPLPMNSFYPVIISHSINHLLRCRPCPSCLRRYLAVTLISCSASTHVCHRKNLVITDIWFLGIVFKVFLPFGLICNIFERELLTFDHQPASMSGVDEPEVLPFKLATLCIQHLVRMFLPSKRALVFMQSLNGCISTEKK